VPAPAAKKDVESQWVAPTDELAASTTEAEYSEPANEIEDSDLVVEPEKSAVVDGALRAPARWERLLVDSAVIGGKDRWARRLEDSRMSFVSGLKTLRLKRRLGLILLEGIFETSMLCENMLCRLLDG